MGFHTLVIKSSGFPRRCLRSWEKRVFLLPTCLLLHKEKIIPCYGCTAMLPKWVLTVVPKYL